MPRHGPIGTVRTPALGPAVTSKEFRLSDSEARPAAPGRAPFKFTGKFKNAKFQVARAEG
eukprot:2389499-Rhodomonas_salina.4